MQSTPPSSLIYQVCSGKRACLQHVSLKSLVKVCRFFFFIVVSLSFQVNSFIEYYYYVFYDVNEVTIFINYIRKRIYTGSFIPFQYILFTLIVRLQERECSSVFLLLRIKRTRHLIF